MNFTSIDIYQSNRIIDQKPSNGRVNILDKSDPNMQFKMQERIAVKNKATEYRDAMTGVQEADLLAKVYFSSKNIQIVQNGLRAGVYKMSNNKFVIAPQNIDALKVIMRSIYLQRALNQPTDIAGQVAQLNQYVLEYAVPSVYGEAVGYEKYCEDQSTLVVPLELPRQSDRDYKELEYARWV
jgi:hypothetical protein